MTEELEHAKSFAGRIKDLYGTVPGSLEFTAEQSSLQLLEDSTDDGADWATQDVVIEILRDEENHLRRFERYLKEFE